MKVRNILLWICRIVPAAILFTTAYGKLSSKPVEVQLFTALGMEPTGRYIIGVVEGSAALFLLTPRFGAAGALLALGTMLGALIAHLTIIGFDLKHVVLLGAVLGCSLAVMIAERRKLPFIGRALVD